MLHVRLLFFRCLLEMDVAQPSTGLVVAKHPARVSCIMHNIVRILVWMFASDSVTQC